MKYLYNKVLILTVTSLLIGCATNTPIQPTQTEQNSKNTSNMKLYPYKSGILKFKQKNLSLTWDEWGKKTYETNRNEAIAINNGTEYRIDHDRKLIKKSRNLILDWLIVADQDLHNYYISNDAQHAIINMQKTETVAGLSCNIWLDNIPTPSNRYCLYENKILLKHEQYNNGKWSVKKEVTFAKFNTSIKQDMFTKLPNYPIKNLTKYHDDKELHALIKNDPAEYKKALQVAETVKARGEQRKNHIQRNSQNNKKMLELYRNHSIGNAVYYP